jgi:hypothetical protein
LLLIFCDLALLTLVTLRLTRLVTTDSLGQWWLYAPAYKRAYGRPGTAPKWAKYVEGLTCPFCVGFWIGAVALLSLLFVGGPGEAAVWWRYATGVFALNWIVGHAAARLD